MKSKSVKNSINAKSGFADSCKIKNQVQEDQPKIGKDSPWDFCCPQYDQRSSNFINAGTHYGVGVRQPSGSVGNPTQGKAVPKGRVNTMRIDEIG
jgi:hypothetical protein